MICGLRFDAGLIASNFGASELTVWLRFLCEGGRHCLVWIREREKRQHGDILSRPKHVCSSLESSVTVTNQIFEEMNPSNYYVRRDGPTPDCGTIV